MKIRKKYRRRFDVLVFAESALENWFSSAMNYYLKCKAHLAKQTQKVFDDVYKEYDLNPDTQMEYRVVTKTIEAIHEDSDTR